MHKRLQLDENGVKKGLLNLSTKNKTKVEPPEFLL